MTRSYFLRIVALMPFMLSGVSTFSKATHYFNGVPYVSNPFSNPYKNWILPNSYFNNKKQYDAKFNQPFIFNKSIQWLPILTRSKKEGEKKLDIVHYHSKKSIVFDARKNILSLHGDSSVSYDQMKLAANLFSFHLNTNTIRAKGTKDLHNKSIENPVFIYNDVTKNKYGKAGTTQTRIFFMEKIRYNIDTKRALVDNLLTKQEDAIIKSKQVKKDDEETFYAQDIIFTTCGLADPHFYIRTKRAKLVQDKQITTGPFRFYFDNAPTPLGFFFGTLFLEGKRTHGIIPPEIGEGDNGFYLRNGGYYINFKDYADISMLGTIYSSGSAELKNELRYKKRYLCSGSIYYAHNFEAQEKGWSVKWKHKTLTYGTRSFNANVNLRSRSYKTFDHEDKQLTKAMENQSSGSLAYEDQLVGLPYRLTLRAAYNHNFLSNFKHWHLPKGTLSSASWYPFKKAQFKGANHWFHNVELKHTINFENHFQNAKKDSSQTDQKSTLKIPSTAPWNRYIENGLQHTIPLSMQCKLFDFINLKPHLNYSEAWYWLPKGTKGPISVPGFNRVYVWDFGSALDTALYHTHYFKEGSWIEGFRIKTVPTFSFTYTPDFSKNYFEEVEKDQGKKEKKYAFAELRPSLNLSNRATSILKFELHNTVELKVKKAINPEEKEKEKKPTSRKIFLLKNLDFNTQYDFKAEKCHLIEGLHLHVASEAEMEQIGKVGLDLTVNFDPYLSETISLDSGQIKEEPINVFAWHHGGYLGKVKEAKFKVNIDCAHYLSQEKKKKKALLNDSDQLTNKIKDHKIDFDIPWNFSLEFNWQYTKLYKYKDGDKQYTMNKYITFNGDTTLVKKWKVGLRSTYDFTEGKFQPFATEISIQRDLHCWQLSYQWHPLGESAKYDFCLGVKANMLKALKLPRKRSYNKLN